MHRLIEDREMGGLTWEGKDKFSDELHEEWKRDFIQTTPKTE